MTGTILITGANGSLAIPAVQHLLTNYPDHTVILTVRNSSNTDVNTNRLRAVLESFPNSRASIHELDHARLSSVHEFANSLRDQMSSGKLPSLAAIVCNAYYWNLKDGVQTTEDGYEKTFQVSYLAHVVLVLRLLRSFDSRTGGRIVLFSSDSHWPGKNGMEKYPPAIPDDLESLVKPDVRAQSADNFGRGFQRYAIAKLTIVTWMYALNFYLQKEPDLSHITAVAINPGNLTDSRALTTNTPLMIGYLARFILRPLRPLLSFMDPTLRTSAEAGLDVVDLAVNKAYPDEHGYFTLLKKDVSSPESQEKEKQKRLWMKSAEWVGINMDNFALD